MNRSIVVLIFGTSLIIMGISTTSFAVDADYLNTKPTYGDRITKGVSNLVMGKTDPDHFYSRPPYTERVAEKAGRGFTNFFLAPYEFKNSYKEEYEKNNLLASAFTTGLLKGAIRGSKRMVVGFYEFFTCIFPQDPIILPEYVTDPNL